MTRLIDADALKAEMQKNSYSVEFCREHNIDYAIDLSVVLMTIDAAQTVDLKDIYQEGHYDGHLEGYTKAINEERAQQGEWIDYNNTFYKCPECGYLLEKCCPHCQNKVILPKGGADMPETS